MGFKPSQYMKKEPYKLLHVLHTRNEMLLFCDDTATKRQFFGIGLVKRIARGENFDVVYVQFGARKQRPVVVISNRARRQILTLKRGQFALFSGLAQLIREKRYFDENDPTKFGYYAVWTFNAYMCQGMFVPTMFDVKKRDSEIELGEEENQVEELTNKEENYFTNVVDDLLNGKEEEEDEIFGAKIDKKKEKVND